MKRSSDFWDQVKIKPVYPLFIWRQCIKCKEEFLKEHGWKLSYTRPALSWDLCETIYVCQSCCPNKHLAKEAFRRYLNPPKPAITPGAQGGTGQSSIPWKGPDIKVNDPVI